MQITNLHPYLKISTKLAFLATLLLAILGNIFFIAPLIILFLFELYVIIENRYFIKQVDIQPLLQIKNVLFKYLSMLLCATAIFMIFIIFNQVTLLFEQYLTNDIYYGRPVLYAIEFCVMYLGITILLTSICMFVGSFLLELILTKLSFKMLLKYCVLAGSIIIIDALILTATSGFSPSIFMSVSYIIALCVMIIYLILNESLLIKDPQIMISNKKIIFLCFITMIYTFAICSSNFLYSSLAFIFLLDINNYLFKDNKRNSGLILLSAFIFIGSESLIYVTYFSNASFEILTALITLYTCIFFGFVLIFSIFKFSLIKLFKGAMDVWIK